MKKVTCPECNGYGPGQFCSGIDCEFCSCSGQVTQEQYDEWHQQKAERDKTLGLTPKNKDPRTVYKIRDKRTGDFMNAGFYSGKEGKTWSTVGGLKSAIRHAQPYFYSRGLTPSQLEQEKREWMDDFNQNYEIVELICTENVKTLEDIGYEL